MVDAITIIENIFFGFWYVLVDYFFAVFAFAIFVSILLALYNFVCRR